MKIAYIAAAQIPSTRANSIQVMKVCQALKQNGEAIKLLVPGSVSSSWQSLKSLYGLQTPFEIEWIPSWKMLRYMDFTANAVRAASNWHADLIYTRMLQVASFASLFGKTVILELHDIPSGRFGLSRLRGFLRRSKVNRIVFITVALKLLVEEALGEKIPDEMVFIAPDGVDLERYENLPLPSEARKILGVPDRFTALYSGSFYQGRGIEILFGLAHELTGIQFLWVGGKPDEVEHWRLKCLNAGLNNVILTGFVDNSVLPSYQAAADILLMPYGQRVATSSGGDTARVASPIKLFEYMASGRAIISSDLPVLHEVLNEQNAVFCPPDDLETWTAALGTLAMDDARRKALGEQALTDVQQYSWRNRMRQVVGGWTTLL